MDLKKCPKCKKQYNEHPAISRADNYTRICPICGETEAIAQFMNYGIPIKPNELSDFEKKVRKSVIRTHMEFSKIFKEEMKKRQDERSRIGQEFKKLQESS